MSHRRIIQTQRGWAVTETGTGRVLAECPIDPVWEPEMPAERTAREIRNYPKLLDFVRHLSFHGCDEAKKLLEGLK